ncbi:MAG: bacteriohemerythrin [Burkholderiaceae bacterium]
MAQFFAWEDRYSVGIASIDRHHKVLVDYINQLAGALGSAEQASRVQGLLVALRTYTKMHFNFEEALFRQYGYEERDAHQTYHANLVRKVDDFAQRVVAGDPQVAQELLEFLKQWLNHHILHEDMAYAEFLRAKMNEDRRAPRAIARV